MNNEDWPINERELEAVNEALSMTKTAAERQEGLEILEQYPMTLPLLIRSGAGRKICRVFKSSRFFDVAHKTHSKWLRSADDEIQNNWDQLKGLFLSKKQLMDLDKAQANWERSQDKNKTSTRSTASSQGLLQIASSSSSQYQRETAKVTHSRIEPPNNGYYGDSSQLYSSTVTDSTVTNNFSNEPKRRGRPRGGGKIGVVDIPTMHEIHARRGGRRGRLPARFLD